MPMLLWHEWLVVVSFFASIAGLALLIGSAADADSEWEATDKILFRMIFSYWLVHCLAVGCQKLPLPNWDVMQMSVQFTSITSYLLTFACVISLPLKRLSTIIKPVE